MRKESGFTLVEIIVAAVIFALVIIGLLSLFVAGSKHIIHVRERMTSAQLGKFFLDPLQVHVRQDQWLFAGPGNKLALGSWPGAVQTINNRNFTETQHDVTPVSGTDLRRVTTKITWTEPSP